MTAVTQPTTQLGEPMVRPRLVPARRSGRREARVEGGAASSFARATEQLADVPEQLAQLMRPMLPQMVSQITDQIQDRVTAYAGTPGGRRRKLISQAVGGATQLFVDIIEGRGGSSREVDELFRRMGRGEAMEGNDLHAMRSALEIAMRDAWAELRSFALREGLSAELLGRFGDALFAFIDALIDQVTIGYAAGQEALERDLRRGRDALLRALLTKAPAEEIERLADAIRWVPPSQVLVCVAETTASHPPPTRVRLDAGVLVRIGRPHTLLVVDAVNGREGLTRASDWFAHGRVANSWPVPLDEVPDALRWARRALELADLGVLDVGPVIEVEEHLPTLWLHSEPALRGRLTQIALGPLLEETPHSRRVLAETLMLWLDTHASAPAIGAQLHVHPQTVRYRLRKLQAMFGDRLTDPDQRLAILLALHATLPLWWSGHEGETPNVH